MNDVRPKQGYGFIYMYTSPSGKGYVGQTQRSLYQRAGGPNGKAYRKCPLFYQAIKKYGFENFDVEILAEVKIDQLDEAERKYIHLFNTLAPNGYNFLTGGQGEGFQRSSNPVYQYDLNTGELLQEFDSIQRAAQMCNFDERDLQSCLRGERYNCHGYCWSRVKMKKYPLNENVISNKAKQIEMYDLKGNLIQTFPSLGQAADFVNGARSLIRRCCRGECNTAYGYKWRCYELQVVKKYNNTAKTVLKLDKETNEVLEVFPSISAAARSCNEKGTSGIRRVLNKDNLTAYGYKWKTAQGAETTDS